MKTRNCLWTTLVFCFICLPFSAAQDEDGAKAKGTEIGTIISGAIDTALPGFTKLATSIIGIFKPRSDNEKEKADKMKAAIKSAQDELVKKFQGQIEQAEPLATQLTTLGPFLQYGFRASYELSSLTEYVASNPNPTKDDWSNEIKPRWAKVKGALNGITYTSAQIEKQVLSDELERMLLQILEAKQVTVGSIDVMVSGQAAKNLPRELKTLSDTLATLHVVGRIQIRNMADQVDILVKWAKTGQSGRRAEPMPVDLREDADEAMAILTKATMTR